MAHQKNQKNGSIAGRGREGPIDPLVPFLPTIISNCKIVSTKNLHEKQDNLLSANIKDAKRNWSKYPSRKPALFPVFCGYCCFCLEYRNQTQTLQGSNGPPNIADRNIRLGKELDKTLSATVQLSTFDYFLGFRFRAGLQANIADSPSSSYIRSVLQSDASN